MKIEKYESIDYSNDTLEYFWCEDNNSKLINYEEIINKMKNAKSIINISSTINIADELIDTLYQNNNVNIYIILKSFKSSENILKKFNEKKPAILREVNQLENNFIIIDNISYVFINSLGNKENVYISFDEEKTKDLKYIFNYYFWDCASKEKLVNTIDIPKESPFPPLGTRELQNINLIDEKKEILSTVFIPRNKIYIDILNKENIHNKYFSDDIEVVLFQDKDLIQLGNLKFREIGFSLYNRWKLLNSELSQIDTNIKIIPKDEDWNNYIYIKDRSEINSGEVTSNCIENMNNIKPSEFKKEKYSKKITYNWIVSPPLKSKDAKKSKLYKEYDELNSEYFKQLNILKNELDNLIKESGTLNSFLGTNKKAKEMLKEIDEYRKKDLSKLNNIELEELLKKFKFFIDEVNNSHKNFKEEKKEKEAKKKWEEEKKNIENKLQRKEKELKEKESNIMKLEQKTKPHIKLGKEIKRDIEYIDKLKQEIKDDYNLFRYEHKENELSNFNKNKSNNDFKELKQPIYLLPEVGTLYENNSSYYLEIEYMEDLEKANELKQRYKNKEYKVVVKEGSYE